MGYFLLASWHQGAKRHAWIEQEGCVPAHSLMTAHLAIIATNEPPGEAAEQTCSTHPEEVAAQVYAPEPPAQPAEHVVQQEAQPCMCFGLLAWACRISLAHFLLLLMMMIMLLLLGARQLQYLRPHIAPACCSCFCGTVCAWQGQLLTAHLRHLGAWKDQLLQL